MEYFAIIEISLLGFPILGFLLFLKYKKHKTPKNHKRLFYILITVLTIYYGLRLFDISIIGDMPDIIMFSLTYFTYSILVFWALFIPQKIIRIPVLIIGLLPILFGYILSTVGLIGLMMFIGDIETTNNKTLTDQFSYREYRFGNATTACGGKEFDFYKKYKFSPFEKKIVNIKMDYRDYDLEDLNIKFSENDDYYEVIIKSREIIQIDTLIKK